MKYRAVFAALFFFSFFGWMDGLKGQSGFRLSIPAHLSVGVNFAGVEEDAGSLWFQAPGAAVLFSSGIGVRYKESLTFNAELGYIIDLYDFRSNYASYDVSHVVPEARFNLSGLITVGGDRMKAIHIGGEYGWRFTRDAFRLASEPGFIARTDAFGPFDPFVSPEIGLARRGPKGQFSLLAAYVYHLDRTDMLRFRITEPNGVQYIATSRGDYLALRMRANFDVAGHKKPVQEYPEAPAPAIAGELTSRDTRTRDELDSRRQVIYMTLRDNADIDGDSVAVSLNGRFIVTDAALTKEKTRVRIVLEPGDNIIVVHALNEGTVPPNTAECYVRTGLFKRKKLVISTSLKRNEAIVVRY
jgi:hypothetical protein